MKRILFAVILSLFSISIHAQVNSQRVIFSSSNPPTACVPGKVYTNTGLSPAKAWVGTSAGTCTEIDASSVSASKALDNLASVNINTSLLAQTGVDLGSTVKPFRDLFLFGSGAYGTTSFRFTGTPTANRVWTWQDATDTVVGRATTDELTNKTLTASVGKGTWTASGTWTLPAFTLGGTVSGGGNQINNVVIGASTPLAGTFTTLISGLHTVSVGNTTSAQTDLLINPAVKASGNLIDLQVGSVSQFNVNQSGNLRLAAGTGVQLTSIKLGFGSTGNLVWHSNSDGSGNGVSGFTLSTTTTNHLKTITSTADSTLVPIEALKYFIGGPTSSSPMIKASGTTAAFRLGDDSADAPISVSTAALSGTLTVGTQQTIGVSANSSALTDLLINPTTKTSGNLIDAQINSVPIFTVSSGGTASVGIVQANSYYSINTGGYYSSSSLESGMTVRTAGNLDFRNGSAVRMSLGTGGAITLTSGITTATGTPGSLCYNTSTFEMTKNNALTCTVSSARFKQFITSLPALSAFDRLRPVQFAYRDNPSRLRYGFIAEEVAAADRRFADGYDATGRNPTSLDQNAILAAAVAEIQQLKARIAVLEKRDARRRLRAR